MKILIINNAGIIQNSNGEYCIEKNIGDFVNGLRSFGNHIQFFGQYLPSNTNSISSFSLDKNNFQYHISKRRKNKMVNYLLLYLKSIKLIYKSDFIYIFFPSAFKYTALQSIILNKKFGIYVRGMEEFYNRYSKFVYKKANAIFTVSDHFTQSINQITKKNNAQTISPMIAFTEEDIVKNREYDNTKELKLLFLGRISREKGLYELLHAVHKLKEKYKFHLNIVGDGDDIDTFKELVKELQISSHVTFKGAVFDPIELKKHYCISDLYILPTYHEGFPRTIYEAMIFGTPIITTFVGGIPSLMESGYNCLKIKAQSVDSIYSVLESIFLGQINLQFIAHNATGTILDYLRRNDKSHHQLLNEHLSTNASKTL